MTTHQQSPKGITVARQIYINLTVRSLDRSMAFFTALGFTFGPKFTNDSAAGMIVDENIFVMLLVEDFFKSFTHKKLCNARQCTECLVCLSCNSRAQVDELVAGACEAGGRIPRDPQDHGFMYGHAFEDLDGHIRELVYMEPDAPGRV